MTLGTIAPAASPATIEDRRLSGPRVGRGGRPARSFDPLAAIWIVLAAGLVALVALPVRLESQALVNAVLVAGLIATRKIQVGPTLRIFYLAAASSISLRYFFWRSTDTLTFHDAASFAIALALYFAECYGIVVYLLGVFVNASPLERPEAPLPADRAAWPSIDVMVPSYNESPELLEVTLLAAARVRYPADKLRVFLLDDGGTVQKREDKDPEKARAALARHEELQELCRRVGVTYLTRERNTHAKAGNVNAALDKTKGELIMILDADHVPAEDILERTAGFFLEDEKLFLVQTPHFFLNPDPIEKNLDVFHKMPSENEMFYGVIQKGLDFWGASFFCGSAALLRRSCLEEIGGISGSSITEDAETALELHARGYRSAYVSRPMIAGLQPETFTGFVVQRVRWAQGMVQIFLLKNPLLKRGLSWNQRLCYVSSSFFWFFCYARVVFLVAPVAHLVFGLQVYDANLAECATYAIPHIAAAVLVSQRLFGRVRWTLVSELYELMQSLFSLGGVIKVLRNPRAPQFIVTPKGEQLDRDFVSPLARPFYALLAIAFIAGGFGLWRYLAMPAERDAVSITMAWNAFNVVLLLGGLGALYERRQTRATPRIPCRHPGELLMGTKTMPCQIVDVSVGGAGLLAPGPFTPEDVHALPERGFIRVLRPAGEDPIVVAAEKRYAALTPQGALRVGLRLEPGSVHEKAEIVALVHGDSDQWIRMLAERQQPVGVRKGALFLVGAGLRAAFSHGRAVAAGAVQRALAVPRHVLARVGAIALLLALAVTTSRAAAPERAAQEPGTDAAWSFTMPLQALVPGEGALTLRHADSHARLWVPLAERLAVESALLHLELTSSISLLESRSQLRVELEGRVVAQIPLRPRQPVVVADIPLPRELFRPGYSELMLRVAQHYTLECEDPTAPELWTQIDLVRSELRLRAVHRVTTPRLSELDDVFDKRLWTRYALDVRRPAPARDAHLRWGALGVQGAALRLGHVALDVVAAPAGTPLDEGVARDALVVGTRDELRALLGESFAQSVDGPMLALRPRPGHPGHVLVVVTGREDAEVDIAARALAHLETPLPDAATVTLADVETPVLADYSAPRAVGARSRHRFDDLGFSSVTLAGLAAGRAELALTAPPDLFSARERDVELRLHLAYGAGMRRDSVLNVLLNGRFENVIHLSDEHGAVFRDYRLTIPLRSFKPGPNVISFEPRMMPLITGDCQSIQDQNLLVTVFGDSEIVMPEATHRVRLPDLALVAATGFPFTKRPDGAGLAIELADGETGTIEAALALLARLAQISGAPLHQATIGAEAHPQRERIVIGVRRSLDPELVAKAPLALASGSHTAAHPTRVSDPRGSRADERSAARQVFGEGAPRDLARAPAARITQIGGLGRFAVAMHYESPQAPGRSVLVVTAEDGDTLGPAVRALVEPGMWSRLDGDVALFMPDGAMDLARVGTDYVTGEGGPATALAFAFSSRPLAWLAVIVVVVGLFAAATERILKRRRKRLAAGEA